MIDIATYVHLCNTVINIMELTNSFPIVFKAYSESRNPGYKLISQLSFKWNQSDRVLTQ